MSAKTSIPSIERTHLKGVGFWKQHPIAPPLSLYGTFVLLNRGHMDDVAIEEDGRIITKRRMKEDIKTVMRSLKALGMTSRDRLVLVGPNSYEGITISFAANALGIGIVYLNHFDAIENNIEDVNLYQARLLFTTGKDREYISKIRRQCPCVQYVVCLDGEPNQHPDCFTAFEFLKKGEAFRGTLVFSILFHLLSNKETIFLQTSGSSGRAKNLPFSNRNVFASLMYCSNSTDIKVCDPTYSRCLCIVPYRLPYGWGMIFINLVGGQTVILAPATDEAIAHYYQHEADVIYGYPTILRTIIDKTPPEADYSALKVFFSGGFPLPDRWYRESMDYFAKHHAKAQVCCDYGFGEGLCIGTSSKDVAYMPNTVGKFFVGPEWRIVDENFNEVPYGVEGQIIECGKSTIKGYFGNPEATQKAFREIDGKRFFCTGDRGSMDENGVVSCPTREVRFYAPIGALDKVYCSIVEDAIMSIGIVSQCAVISNDGVSGMAFIVLRSGNTSEANAREIIERELKESLMPYQIPETIVFLESIPHMSSGKVNYLELSRMVA